MSPTQLAISLSSICKHRANSSNTSTPCLFPWESSVINTDTIQHDAVLDYYGRRLATCSSDKTIKIFEIEGETQRLTETLKGYGCLLTLTWEIENAVLLTMSLQS